MFSRLDHSSECGANLRGIDSKMRAYTVNEYRFQSLEDIEIGEIASETDFEEQVEAPEEE